MYYEKFTELINTIKNSDKENKDRDLNDLEKSIEYFINYVSTIYKTSVKAPIFQAKYNKKDIENANIILKDLKQNNYEAVVDACNLINITCRQYGLKPFCPHPTNETEVTEFAGNFVAEVFKTGIQKGHRNINEIMDNI